MFAPLTPIQPDSRAEAAVDSLLARVDAIQTVLHVLGRLAGHSGGPALESLNQRAVLSARLAERETARLAYIVAELDAVSAALQSGFAALDRARKAGHPAVAAASFLYREASQDFAAILAAAGADQQPA